MEKIMTIFFIPYYCKATKLLFYPFPHNPTVMGKWAGHPSMLLHPSPDMPILDSSSLTANKDMTSKMWTNGDTDIC